MSDGAQPEGAEPAAAGPLVAAPGRNCWRVARAGRFAFLVDAAAYYAAFAEAAERARRSIFILGWDIDVRTRLWRDPYPPPAPGLPAELGPFLQALTRRQRDLRVHVLAWDVSLVFGIDRAFLPFQRLLQPDSRVRYELDAEHPLGGAAHQKIVVVDDRVAFVGGLDLTSHRWDTRAHAPLDRRRREAGEDAPYRPFHDVQVVLDGEAAARLGDLARKRWEVATGRRLQPGWRERARSGLRLIDPRRGPRRAPAPADGHDRWPASVRPSLLDVDVAIARTEPEDAGRPEVREVEQLYLDSIASARRSIYMENQYFTSTTIAQAIGDRLAGEDPPDVVLVQPDRCQGWLEETTVGQLRSRQINALRERDREGRLRVYHPVVPGASAGEAPGQSVSVHSKVLVVDEALVRVGSANASNRSMALDTECDVQVEAAGREDVARAITGFRDRLLAEHLGTSEERVAEAVREHGRLGAAVEALRGGERSLVPLETEEPAWLAVLGPAIALADPERPREMSGLPQALVREEARRLTPGALGRGLLLIGLLVLLAATWRLSLGDELARGTLVQAAHDVRAHPLGSVATLGAFVVGGLVAFPVTILIALTTLTYGPWWGFLLAMAGSFASAIITYLLGRAIGRPLLRVIGGRAANRVSRVLARHGLVAIAVTRVVPLAPFSVVNVVAGASHIRPLDFVAGTVLGLVPAVAASALLAQAIAHPGRQSLLALSLLAVPLGALALWMRRRARRAE